MSPQCSVIVGCLLWFHVCFDGCLDGCFDGCFDGCHPVRKIAQISGRPYSVLTTHACMERKKNCNSWNAKPILNSFVVMKMCYVIRIILDHYSRQVIIITIIIFSLCNDLPIITSLPLVQSLWRHNWMTEKMPPNRLVFFNTKLVFNVVGCDSFVVVIVFH